MNVFPFEVGIEPKRSDDPSGVRVCGITDASGLSPPHDLRLPEVILEAQLRQAFRPDFQYVVKPSSAQAAGLRYEKKVQALLGETFPGFIPGPWFVYRDSPTRAKKLCQPDGIWVSSAGVFIFEVKFRWCAEAWWKMKRLYAPVAEKALGIPVLGLCVVTRGVDPAIPVPERPRILESLDTYKESPPLGGSAPPPVDVFIWKGNER